ncbi:GNAT family N-acetyltransferase [Terrisporobacter vanillatitrophus]|uniref:GNAT family N-acetyltransferase n=1 Tax=Terrisporobacter vanillatitrophus TaxID=3058402 RepID=UPI003366A898
MKMVSTKNNLSVVLRSPKENDAKEIIEFYNIVGGETTYLSFGADEYKVSVEQQKHTIKSVNKSDNNTMILATIDDKIISIGTIYSNQKKKGKHVGELGIVIKEEYCNLGLGKIMMDELINWCKSNGITTRISLAVRKDNPRAIELYKKCGFEEEGLLKNETYIDGEYFDIMLMGLIL